MADAALHSCLVCMQGSQASPGQTPHASSAGETDAQGQPDLAAGGGANRASSPSDAATEDWGLLVLVAIGEKWLRPLSQVTSGASHDSMSHLYMIAMAMLDNWALLSEDVGPC